MRGRGTRPAIVLAVVVLILPLGAGKADNLQILYHTQADTFGCADPAATRALTDPNEARRKNPAWIKSVFNDGRCVSITPKSPWRLVSRAGDVALMDYAGTVGPPGSYYLRIDQLVDANGNRPGDAQLSPNGPPAPPAAIDSSSATALAPGPQPALAVQPTPVAPAVSQPTWTTADIFLLLVALALAAFGGFVLGRRSSARQ